MNIEEVMSAAQRPEVIIADDDREILARISAVLRRDGCRVTTVHDGSELLQVLADSELKNRRRPDVLIAGVHMPGYPGANILVSLRNAGWDTPIILMTEDGDGQVEQLAREKNARWVPHRPIDLDGLRNLVYTEAYVRSAL